MLDGAIERRSLRDEVVQRVRAGIVYGEIEPGTIHSAPLLAARMGVSITPVREALLELASRGMVTQVRNRGFRVVERSPADLDAALELRALVEIPMLARLASALDPATIAEFRAIVDEGIEAARDDDHVAFLDLDRRFHTGLLARAGNPRVVDVVDQLLDQLRLATFARTEGAPPLVSVADGHADILDAIATAGPAKVERAARAHLDLTRTAWSDDRRSQAGVAR